MNGAPDHSGIRQVGSAPFSERLVFHGS
jgi:hypothetical protein